MLQQIKSTNLQMYLLLYLIAFSVYGYVEEEDKETEADLFFEYNYCENMSNMLLKRINAG